MPSRDGTGPDGKGSRTGRGLGDCDPKPNENLDSNRPRRNRRFNSNRRFGRNRGV